MKRRSNPKKNLLLTCRQATRLASDALDRPLLPGQRAALALHLAVCRLCRRYHAQLRFIRKSMRLLGSHLDSKPDQAADPD